jgi:hypothetical protein
MAKWRSDDDKANRRMRKLVEKKRKDKLTRRRFDIYGQEDPEDQGLIDELDFPRDGEESQDNEVQRIQEEVKEKGEEIDDRSNDVSPA